MNVVGTARVTGPRAVGAVALRARWRLSWSVVGHGAPRRGERRHRRRCDVTLRTPNQGSPVEDDQCARTPASVVVAKAPQRHDGLFRDFGLRGRLHGAVVRPGRDDTTETVGSPAGSTPLGNASSSTRIVPRP